MMRGGGGGDRKAESGRDGGIPEVPYGTVVGNDFMVERPLSRGSMGALYVAEQLSTSSKRALKILRRDYVSDATLYKRFEREAQVAAKIPSEHVAQTIAAGVDRKLDVPWIAMELLSGQNLAHHIEETGPIEKDLVRQYLEQLCHALAAAHKLGIVHRDLKPANIFLSEARRIGGGKVVVKILDFGIAKIIAESVTLQGAPLGTPNWMAPEQTTGESATTATDVWALGLLAFYMLTGKTFWRASLGPSNKDNAVGVMREILHDPIPIAWARAIELGVMEKIPQGFNEWFAQCVARPPSDRFVHAGAAYAALSSALA
jgi:eukaryotic-like serine/threonine-protein kinase